MGGVAVLASTAPDAELEARGRATFGRAVAGELRTATALAGSGRWLLATIRPGTLVSPPPPHARGALAVAFHGIIENRTELARQLSGPPPDAGTGDAWLFAALWDEHGSRIARHVRGSYQAIVVDSREGRVHLVNDRLGSYPLYWAMKRDRLAAAPTVTGVLASLPMAASLDLRAAADYVHFGFVFGNRTLASGVELVPPGSVVSWSLETGHVATMTYWRLADAFKPWEGDKAEYFEVVGSAFNEAVQRAAADATSVGMSLSGGLDSRVILSALSPADRSVITYTVGVPGCADEAIANRLSRLARTTHRFFAIDERYLRDFLPNLERMVTLTDGMYLSHGLTEMLALGALDELAPEVLLRGHCGELAKTSLAWPFHTDDAVYAGTGREAFVSYMAERANYVSRGVSPSELFIDADLSGAAVESLRAMVSDVDLTPAQLCTYVYIEAHQRRFTVPSLELFRTRVRVGLPFADTGFLEVLLRGPADWRDGTDIHKFIIRTNDARLLAVRNSNTGAPAGAGPLVEAVMDKVNTVLKRLNAPGYRHYHRLDRWMHGELLASVEAVLLDPMTLARGAFRPEVIRRLVSELRAGRTEHAHLLEVLLHIELWQRQNAV